MMRQIRSHIDSFCLSAILTALLTLWALPARAQTSPGTHILNEASASYKYKDGSTFLLRSNTTETVVQAPRSTAASITITVTPDAIIGNGADTAQVTARVLDVLGNPVPDGAVVSFKAAPGTFPGGKDTLSLPTTNGSISVRVTSTLVSQQLVLSTLTATTKGADGQELLAVASLLFYPGAIAGAVISGSSGRPIEGAVIVARNSSQIDEGHDTTGANGKYLIPVARAGSYTHTVSCHNRYGDLIQALFHDQLEIPAQGGIPPTGSLNVVTGNIVDRVTGNPIRQAGIHVTIRQAGTMVSAVGSAASLYGATDSRGVFEFDSLSPGIYEIRVTEPGYAGTAIVYDTLASSLLVDGAISVSNVPSFQVVKTSSKRIAEIGDAVAYVLELRNTSATAPLTRIRIIDDLPLGFVYVNGTSRHEKLEIADPAGSRRLEWSLPDTLQPGKMTRLSYMTTVGSGAMDGDGINQAFGMALAPAGDTIQSAVATVGVVVRPGVFTDHGIVIGKIFFEEVEDGVQQYGEVGIAGVELWMEDGTHIITGDDGKYSLPDVKPGQHVIRVDQRTLPTGSVALAIGSESARDGKTRFIRLVEGGVARADFHIRPPRQASVDVSVKPSSSTGLLQASFIVRCNSELLPSSIVLNDTLPKGLFYDLRTVTVNGSAVAGLSGQSRSLHVELPARPTGVIDTVRVFLVKDSSSTKRVGVLRPRLVLSYPQRREAVFGTVETFPIPDLVAPVPGEKDPMSEQTRTNRPAGVLSGSGEVVKKKGSM